MQAKQEPSASQGKPAPHLGDAAMNQAARDSVKAMSKLQDEIAAAYLAANVDPKYMASDASPMKDDEWKRRMIEIIDQTQKNEKIDPKALSHKDREDNYNIQYMVLKERALAQEQNEIRISQQMVRTLDPAIEAKAALADPKIKPIEQDLEKTDIKLAQVDAAHPLKPEEIEKLEGQKTADEANIRKMIEESWRRNGMIPEERSGQEKLDDIMLKINDMALASAKAQVTHDPSAKEPGKQNVVNLAPQPEQYR